MEQSVIGRNCSANFKLMSYGDIATDKTSARTPKTPSSPANLSCQERATSNTGTHPSAMQFGGVNDGASTHTPPLPPQFPLFRLADSPRNPGYHAPHLCNDAMRCIALPPLSASSLATERYTPPSYQRRCVLPTGPSHAPGRPLPRTDHLHSSKAGDTARPGLAVTNGTNGTPPPRLVLLASPSRSPCISSCRCFNGPGHCHVWASPTSTSAKSQPPTAADTISSKYDARGNTCSSQLP